jgi:hypothetical protein
MAQPVLNGVLKPADVIARGSHFYNEATRKYEERPQTFSEFPRAMWHETEGYREALSPEQMKHMESLGWQKKPFPEKPKKETILAPAADLALIVLQQQQQMQAMQAELQKLSANQPTTAPAIPEEAKHRKKEEAKA